MPTQITHITNCSAKGCTARHVYQYTCSLGNEAMRPTVDSLWTIINGQPFCPGHRIVVTVDSRIHMVLHE